MSKCAGKNAKHQWDIGKPKNSSCTPEEGNSRCLLDEVEEFDAITLNTGKKMEISVEPAMPCVTQKLKL